MSNHPGLTRSPHRYSLQEQDLALVRPSSSSSNTSSPSNSASSNFGVSSSSYGFNDSSPNSRAFLSASQRMRPSPVSRSPSLAAATLSPSSSMPQSSSFSPRHSIKRNSLSNSVASFDNGSSNSINNSLSPGERRRASNSNSNTSGYNSRSSPLSPYSDVSQGGSGGDRRRSMSADASSRRLSRNGSARMSIGSGLDINALWQDELNTSNSRNSISNNSNSNSNSSQRRNSSVNATNDSPSRRFSTSSPKNTLPDKFYSFLTNGNPNPYANIVQGTALLSSPQYSQSERNGSVNYRNASMSSTNINYNKGRRDSFTGASSNSISNNIENNSIGNSSNSKNSNSNNNGDYRSYIHDLHLRQGTTWEPPLSCQRRICHLRSDMDFSSSVKNEYLSSTDFHVGFNPDSQSLLKHYLPLELTNRDYVARLFGVLRFAISEAFKHSGAVAKINSSSSSSNSSSSLMGSNAARASDFILELLRILFNKDQSIQIEAYWSLIVDSSFYPKQKMLVDSLTFHYFHINQNIELDFGPLVNIVEVISLCKEFLTCFNIKYVNIMELCLKEIADFDAMIKIHSTFKQQRMEALGWRWPQLSDSFFNLDSSIRPSTSSDPSAGGKEASSSSLSPNSLFSSASPASLQIQDPKKYVADEITPPANRLREQAESLIRPSTKNKLILMSRIMCVCRDLASMSSMCEKKQNFFEAKRLFELKEKIHATIEEEDGAPLLDHVRDVCSKIKSFVTSIENDIIGMRIALEIEDVIVMRNIVADLTKLSFALQATQIRYSIVEDFLSDPKLLIDATEHISSLFLVEYKYADGETLGGLLIKCKSQSLLESVWRWPDLVDAQKERLYRSRASRQLFDLSHGTGSLLDPVQVMNLNIADIYEEFENNQSVEIRKNQIHDHPSEMVSSVNGADIGTKSTRGDGLRFAKTTSAAATAVLVLKHLLAETSDAHTRLIARLMGMSTDVRSLSEGVRSSISSNNSSRLNDFLTSEANRLSLLAETVDSSIDADAVDPDAVVGGRSRQRMDIIAEVLSRSEIFLLELKVAIVSAEQAFDFHATAGLMRLYEEMSSCIDKLKSSCIPFSLLDNIPDSQDLIHLKTTDFINGDYLLNLVCKEDNHNVSSLAVISSCSEILFDIHKNWSMDIFKVGFWQSQQSSQSQQLSQQSFQTSLRGSARSAKSTRSASGGADGGTNKLSSNTIDFNAARVLRRVGFSMEVLKTAGFSDVDILFAGFPIETMRQYADFDASSLSMMKEQGISDAVVSAIGQYSLLQNKLLLLLFTSLGGSRWSDSKGWEELNFFQQTSNGVFGVDVAAMTAPFGTSFSTTGSITKMILNSNNLQGYLPDCFQPLRSLQQLCLAGNKLVGVIPPTMYSLFNLTVLQLNNNGLYGEIGPALKNLQSLTILRLDNNRFSGSLPVALCELTKLKKLMLNNNSFSGTIYQINWSKLSTLQELCLNSNNFSGNIPDSCGDLTALYTLNLQNNNFSGALPSSLANLQRLSNLNLSNNSLLPIDRLKLQKVLPCCHIIVG